MLFANSINLDKCYGYKIAYKVLHWIRLWRCGVAFTLHFDLHRFNFIHKLKFDVIFTGKQQQHQQQYHKQKPYTHLQYLPILEYICITWTAFSKHFPFSILCDALEKDKHNQSVDYHMNVTANMARTFRYRFGSNKVEVIHNIRHISVEHLLYIFVFY